MEVTSHKDNHVPPLIEQELWSILLSGESEIMMCGRLIRESGTSASRRKWTLPTKLPCPPPHRFSRAFVVRTTEMIACVDRQVVLSVGFLWWYHWLGEFIFVLFCSASGAFVGSWVRFAGAGRHSFSLRLLWQERRILAISPSGLLENLSVGGWLSQIKGNVDQ